MSTPTLRRIERGAAAAPLSTGKENPTPLRSASRGRAAAAPVQKPTVQKIPRFSRSNSAAPKGRSSSPFEFTRVLSDMRKNQGGVGSRVLERETAARSVSNGRRSVSGDRVQSKVGSFRDSNGKLGDRVDKVVNIGLKEKIVNLKDLDGKSGKRVEKNGEICNKNEGGFGTSRQKDGFFRDSNVKTSEKVEKVNVGPKESGVLGKIEAGLEKNGEFYKKNESGLKGSGDLASRVLDRNLKKKVSLKDSNVELSERVEKFNEKSEEIFKNNVSDYRKSDNLPIRGLKERKSIDSGEGSMISLTNEGKSEDGLSSNLSKSRPNSTDSDIKKINFRTLASSEHEKNVNYTKDSGMKISNSLKVSERLKQKGLIEDNTSGRNVNKYPSKLHEKLAFLEGKVKRIASDIKRTKEMLDINNPDSSKVIISDIQEKISGIEKVMRNVVSTDKQINILEKVETSEKVMEKVEKKEVENVISSVKGLNNEELEARLFPHHKLLRDRTSLKISSTSSEKLDNLMKEKENPVEVEFLSLLANDQNKDTVRSENIGPEFCEVHETDGAETSKSQDSINVVGKNEENIILTTEEKLDDFVEKENKSEAIIDEEIEDNYLYRFNGIGHKISTAGWFVADGEAALLAHDDGSCLYYDIANSEVKSEYKPPIGISPNMWRDCWIIRAPSTDGSSEKYVIAASAGNTLDSGYCSWDFYDKNIKAFHMEDGSNNNTRTALAPLPNNPLYRRNSFSNIIASENRQWWYRPCGPLITSTASNQKGVSIYDIRDGENIMNWEVQKNVLSMDYSSPLQWRNRGKIVITETESISYWDVSSLNSQAVQSISTSGRRVYALHVNNTDGELGGGVRQRVSSSEAEGNDGVFCTSDSTNVLDFRHPSGIGLKISKTGVNPNSIFCRGDSIFLGCTNAKSSVQNNPCSQIQQFSLRKQKLISTYSFPDSNAHPHYTAITQVWGNSNIVMGICGLGLFVFDALKDEYCSMQKVRETIGPDDLYLPSFDYLSSRALLISRDRPALWRYLS